MQIVFYDVATPIAYSLKTLQEEGLGGTEATIIRVAHALKEHHKVFIAQHCRGSAANTCCEGVSYVSLETAEQLNPDVVILLRHYRLADEIGQRFPKARKYLWLHNMPSRELYGVRTALYKHHYQLIAVSHFHKHAIERRLKGRWLETLFQGKAKLPPTHVLYNPIDEDLKKDHTAWKPEQLLFMSSPQKGLSETLSVFEKLRKHFPEYQLLISNPGYNKDQPALPPQAEYLGILPHHQVIQKLRESFCVFYPQTERVETFGLIYAEANAVGTPVLAHHAGAAEEVLSDPSQLVNGQQFSAVLAKIEEWRRERPHLTAKPEFRLSAVTKAWLKLLEKTP